MEQRTKEKELRLKSHGGLPIDFRIWPDGDLGIEDEDGEKYFYVAKEDVPKLRDWLNEVLS